MAHVGPRPTFDADGAAPTVEVHLFDDAPDLYGQALSVRFEHRLRDVLKFDGADALVAQLKQDAERARTFLRQRNDGPPR